MKILNETSILTAAGIAGGALLAVGLFVIVLSPGAAASVQMNDLSVDDTEATADDGRLDGLTVAVNGTYEHDGLDTPARDVTVKLQVERPGGGWDTVATSQDSPDGAAGTADFEVSGDVLAESAWTAEDMAATEDGGTQQTTMTARVVVEVHEPGQGNHVARSTATDDFTVTVNNEAATVGFTASGSATATATDESPSSG